MATVREMRLAAQRIAANGSLYGHVPPEVRDLSQWVVWRIEKRGDRVTKVPYNASAPTQRAAVDDPTTWTTFKRAVAACIDGSFDGIGFVFAEDDDFVGIDLDKCRDPKTGEVAPWAKHVVQLVNGYAEVSPSGTGVHIITRGKLPEGRRRSGPVEIYSEGRFFTITGQEVQL